MTIKTQRLLVRAKKIAKKGEIEEARKLYTSVLKDSPNNQEAKNGLLALDLAKKNLSPPKAEIHSAISLINNGQAQEALETIEVLIKDYPREPLLFNIRGVCCKAIGQLDGAVKSFEKALAIKPEYAEAQYNLGVILKELGQVDAAMKCYEKALTIKHEYPNAHNNLGQIFLELRQLDAAVDHFEWAVAFKPDFAEAHNNLGVTLQELQQWDESIKSYEKAIDIKPDYAEVYNNLGITYHQLLQRDSAIKNYEKAIAIKSNYGTAHHNLSALKKYAASDSQISLMESHLSSTDLSPLDRKFLCFALAKAYEDLGNQEELFNVLSEGNQLRRQELNYSFDKSQNYHSIIRKLFSQSSSTIGESLSYETSSIRPVFIVGMPRSGTSLVEQIVASHHAVYGAGELNTLTKLITQKLKEHYTQDNDSLPEKAILSIRQQYLDSLSRFNVPENVITDKWPLNFRNIGFILSAFPEAKIIHLKRDARATCWSIYKHYFSDAGNGWAYNMDDLAGFYGLYAELMNFWHKLYPDKIYDICYEDLTTNQEEETRNLIKYCELDWDENCLSFHDNKRVVKTASSIQVTKKMYQGSSEAWKKHEVYLKPLIKALSSY